MNRQLLTPAQDADSITWCQWAWLVGQTQSYHFVPQLRDIIFSGEYDLQVRETALSSYWVLSNTAEAIRVEEDLLALNACRLALAGIVDPRWWHENSWLDACQNWFGSDELLDQALIRIRSWANQPSFYARVPQEVLERTHLSQKSAVDWPDMFQIGRSHVHHERSSGFEAFWLLHTADWAARWLQWEEALWRYHWHLEKESRLTQWTQAKISEVQLPELPMVTTVCLAQPERAQDSVVGMVLGLGYHTGADRTEMGSAAWDGIWSSWAASLSYRLFEVLNNVRITEWHIAGMTGTLRDTFYAQSRRL